MVQRTAVLCFLLLGVSLTLTLVGCGYSSSIPGSAETNVSSTANIQHIVVIFQENVSFDHYFGTYPNALNLSGETPFKARPRTPKVNNLANPLDVNHDFKPLAGVDLLNKNPNSIATNPVNPVPFM